MANGRIRASRLPDIIAQFGKVGPGPAIQAGFEGFDRGREIADKRQAALLELEKAKLEMAAKKERERAEKEQQAKQKELASLLGRGPFKAGMKDLTLPAFLGHPDAPRGPNGPILAQQVPTMIPEDVAARKEEERQSRIKELALGLEKPEDLASRVLDPKEEEKFNTIQALITDRVDKGDMTIEQGISILKSMKPTLRSFEDAEGRKGVADLDTGQKFFFKAETKAGKAGKITLDQFTPREQKVISKAREQFNKSEFVKKQGTVLKEMDKIRALVEANPKGGIGATRTQVSKVVAGEVGRLTDQDIERNVPTPDLWPALKQAVKKFKSGNFTDVTLERYKILLDVLQAKMAQSLNTELNSIVDDVHQRGTKGGNRDAIRQMVGRGTVAFIDEFLPKEGGEEGGLVDQGALDAELKKRGLLNNG